MENVSKEDIINLYELTEGEMFEDETQRKYFCLWAEALKENNSIAKDYFNLFICRESEMQIEKDKALGKFDLKWEKCNEILKIESQCSVYMKTTFEKMKALDEELKRLNGIFRKYATDKILKAQSDPDFMSKKDELLKEWEKEMENLPEDKEYTQKSQERIQLSLSLENKLKEYKEKFIALKTEDLDKNVIDSVDEKLLMLEDLIKTVSKKNMKYNQ